MTEAEKVVAEMAKAGATVTLAEAQEYLDATYGRIPLPRAQAVLNEFGRRLKGPLRQLLDGDTPPKNKSDAVRYIGDAHADWDFPIPCEEPFADFLKRTGLTAAEVDAMPAEELMTYRMLEADRLRALQEIEGRRRGSGDRHWSPMTRRKVLALPPGVNLADIEFETPAQVAHRKTELQRARRLARQTRISLGAALRIVHEFYSSVALAHALADLEVKRLKKGIER